MDRTEIFQVLGVSETKDERAIKSAYREKLAATNPEDDPEGFRRLRTAYEEACRFARQTERNEPQRDETPSGQWVERAAEIYGSMTLRRDVEKWKELFEADCFLSLEEEENCRIKLLRFLMEHFRLPGEVWKLLDRKLHLTADAANLREKFPADFIRYLLNKCERGEEVEFDQFEGPEDGPYDLFLQYYDRCWQALAAGNVQQVQQNVESADELSVRHPVMEICRARLLLLQGKQEEALKVLEGQRERYPKDAMIAYHFAEALWNAGKADGGGGYRLRAAGIYEELKRENDAHYMANLRLTEWYCDRGQYRDAKACAEKILAEGAGEEFLELLGRVNRELEKDLEEKWEAESDLETGLELCWCYLQDGRIARGIRFALGLEKRLPPEKEAEWNGLMAKLYVEQAEYETSVDMTRYWEDSLERKIRAGESPEDEEKDRDRLRQARQIRAQCFHNLGFVDGAKFAEAIRECEAALGGGMKDIGILLKMAQVYVEMQEYEKCQETVRRLVEEYQVYAAYATSLEAYRRQLDAGGVVRSGTFCIQYFPAYVKAYEYVAKVYLDLGRWEDFEKILAQAEENGVKSDVLAAYAYQRQHKPMESDILNNRLKAFRKKYRKPVEEGKLSLYEPGLVVLNELLYHCPSSYTFVERGIYHGAAHHYREAREDFEKALSIVPTNPYALNGLSFVCRYQGNYEKALFYVKRAILYMDKDMSPVIYMDESDLYELLGDFGMALAACRQYEELTHDRSRWFLERKAEICVGLGEIGEACRLYQEGCYRQKGEKVSVWEANGRLYLEGRFNVQEVLRRQVKACARCGETIKGLEFLELWARGIQFRRMRQGCGGFLQAARDRLVWLLQHGLDFFPLFNSSSDAAEKSRYLAGVMWIALVSGQKEVAGQAVRGIAARACPEEALYAESIFGAILCGEKGAGKKQAARLKAWLNREERIRKNGYYNREKSYLHLQVLKAWYTESEEAIRELLDREPDCGICHACTSPVCRELEGIRVLFLLRRGMRDEAKERVRRNLKVQPGDEYMRAVRAIAFSEQS